MLGFLIHKASGQFYGDFLNDRIFIPVGMKTTRIISEEDIVPNRAAGYRLVKGELKNQQWVAPSLNTTAEGSLYYSISDLIAWDRALRPGALLKSESWEQVYTPVRLNSGKTYPYGFGWNLEPINGHEMYRHGGAWQGFQTDILRYPKDDLTIIALCNPANANPGEFTEEIVGVIAPELAKPKPGPIPDREPAVTERVRRLLSAAAAVKIPVEEFAYVRAGYTEFAGPYFEELLKDSGELKELVLFVRKELGDDQVYRYELGLQQRWIEKSVTIGNRIL
jgi:CubicO group peptidase (beta-lactamase class C family)